MQAHDGVTRKDSGQRPILLLTAGLLTALGLMACAPAASTGMMGTGTSTTAATGTASGTTTTETATTATTGTTTGTAATGTTGTATTGTTGAATGTTATGTTATATTPPPAATPSSSPGTGPNSSVATSARNDATLATLIGSDDRFTTLNRLIQQAGLAETLAGGQYTVFAPTNDAFLKLAPSDLSAITSDPVRLRQVLLYHVTPSRVTGTALASISRIASAQSGLLEVTRSATRTTIGNTATSAIIEPGASIDTGNGVLYVIDTVLLPPTR
ncbi:fasciclin domain-containing protein [Deinococcus aestuarii]|uniref:fasciclin domain-containing protein n=1 Tax=Deinococcus aestuarii TaxID=2774531 RepID=UPI001C0E8331|nr:fasciclin domain-containing protein [Deinococcus aestuarii]